MIDWEDQAIVLSASPMGETSARVSLLTRHHGRYIGALVGGQSRSKQALLQPGQPVAAHWQARLPEQMGNYALEAAAPYPSSFLEDRKALACLSAACAVADFCLPERETHAPVYDGLMALIGLNVPEVVPYAYVKWELGLLREVGYGLNFERCGATGVADSEADPLSHVSPRTGRAVCQSAAQPYLDKLLPLPAFLKGAIAEAGTDELYAALKLTGYFLEQRVFAVHHCPLPPARLRLLELFAPELQSLASQESPSV